MFYHDPWKTIVGIDFFQRAATNKLKQAGFHNPKIFYSKTAHFTDREVTSLSNKKVVFIMVIHDNYTTRAMSGKFSQDVTDHSRQAVPVKTRRATEMIAPTGLDL